MASGTTNLDEFDDAGGRSVELNFTTLESVVSGAVTPWDRSGRHNVRNVDVIAFEEANVLGSTGLVQHDIPLNRSAGLILDLVLVDQFPKSVVLVLLQQVQRT